MIWNIKVCFPFLHSDPETCLISIKWSFPLEGCSVPCIRMLSELILSNCSKQTEIGGLDGSIFILKRFKIKNPTQNVSNYLRCFLMLDFFEVDIL